MPVSGVLNPHGGWFHGVNCWEEMCTIGSWQLVWASSNTPPWCQQKFDFKMREITATVYILKGQIQLIAKHWWWSQKSSDLLDSVSQSRWEGMWSSAQGQGLALDINMYSSSILAMGEARAYSENSAGSCIRRNLNAYLHRIETHLKKVKKQSEVFGRI